MAGCKALLEGGYAQDQKAVCLGDVGEGIPSVGWRCELVRAG